MSTESVSSLDPSPETEKQVARLLDEAFEAPMGYFADFPVWRDSSLLRAGEIFRKEHRVAGKIVGVTYGRIAHLSVAQGHAPIGMIGAVATSPSLRGQGIASQLVGQVRDELFRRGCGEVVLWGAESPLYQNLGFSPVGEQWLVPLSALLLPELPPDGLPGFDLRSDFAPPLFEALRRQRVGAGLEIRPSDLPWVASHKNVTWAWLQNSLGGVGAYVGVGRGIDMNGVVHEWGGSPDLLASLLAWLEIRVPGLQLLASPSLLAQSQLLVRQPEQIQKQTLALMALAPGSAQSSIDLSKLWFWGLDSA